MAAALRLLPQIVRKSRELAPQLMAQSHSEPFSPRLQDDVDDLHSLISRLSLTELGFEPPKGSSNKPGDPLPPCYHTDVYESEHVSVSIFSLRDSGCKIPLHDHPEMRGFLKVIHGSVRVTYFSLLQSSEEELLSLPPSGFSRPLRPHERRMLKPVLLKGTGQKLVSAGDPACFLTPLNGNIHEVEAVGGMASFLNVLIPKYEPPVRDCHYYQTLEAADPKELTEKGQAKYAQKSIAGLRWLIRVPPPMGYWCRDYKPATALVDPDFT